RRRPALVGEGVFRYYENFNLTKQRGRGGGQFHRRPFIHSRPRARSRLRVVFRGWFSRDAPSRNLQARRDQCGGSLLPFSRQAGTISGRSHGGWTAAFRLRRGFGLLSTSPTGRAVTEIRRVPVDETQRRRRVDCETAGPGIGEPGLRSAQLCSVRAGAEFYPATIRAAATTRRQQRSDSPAYVEPDQ